MILFRRLHGFILKTFLPLFAMTFFIVLFIVLMQFLWRYVDDLVGKGLGIGVLGELFFYAAVSMVPMALPLAILLASLMTFGILGEKFELTAMKASGISLIRVMAPLIVTIGLIAVGAFFFQNDILPKAQVKMWTLLFSMRQKSPELEIPEGVFYDQIPGFNLHVQRKDSESGMLHGVMIYDVSRGGDNATVITADSARLSLTKDMRFLYLHLYQGEQFENLRDQNRSAGANIPFRRETFVDKQVLIPFDANFNRMDEGGMRAQYVGKNMAELRHTMDSINVRIDSIGRANVDWLISSEQPMLGSMRSRSLSPATSGGVPASASAPSAKPKGEEEKAREADEAFAALVPVDIDTLVVKLPEIKRADVFANAISISKRRQDMLVFRAQMTADEKGRYRRHDIELIKKFTLSVACLIFFFIGAPLGAIIRKGGLGTPLVISVLLFLVYYIIDNTGYKMARDGHAEVWVGMWMSTFVLAPLGVYVTWMAMNDSAGLDPDRIKGFFRRLVGIRPKRSVAVKEVIIHDVDPGRALEMLRTLADDAARLGRRYSRRIGYVAYLTRGISRRRVGKFGEEVDAVVEYLNDWRDPRLVKRLSGFPLVLPLWIYRPSGGIRWVGMTLAVLFPVGLPLWFAGMRARRALCADCAAVGRLCSGIEKEISGVPDDASGAPGADA